MNHILTAYKSLRQRRLRSFLTMLGVIIGVFSVYMMLSIAFAVRKNITDITSSININALQITTSVGSKNEMPFPFNENDIILLSRLNGVNFVTGELSTRQNVFTSQRQVNITIRGVDSNFLMANSMEIIYGQNISDVDFEIGEKVVLLGQGTAEDLFGKQYPIGQTIIVKNTPLKIIGIVRTASAGTRLFQARDRFALVPRSTLRSYMVGHHKDVSHHLNSLTVFFNGQKDMNWAEYETEALMRDLRAIESFKKSDFNITNNKSLREQASTIQTTFTFLLGSIGAISLIVGGIGVMNIMLVSVTERTREIGLRISVGATKLDILLQFLIEGILLCGLAGGIGLGLGWLTCQIINMFDVVPLENSLNVGILSFGASVLIGLVFSVVPARRASNLKPIEALRYV